MSCSSTAGYTPPKFVLVVIIVAIVATIIIMGFIAPRSWSSETDKLRQRIEELEKDVHEHVNERLLDLEGAMWPPTPVAVEPEVVQ